MKHSSTQDVYDYWVSKRGRRRAPERSEIEPGAIRGALADTFILAYEPNEGHRFRLAGTRLCAMMGRDLRNRPLIELFARPQRALARKFVAPVIEEASGIVASVSGWTIDSLQINLELLLLPLSHHGGADARILGVLAPLSPPYWLGIKPLHELIAGNVRHLGADAVPVRGRDLRQGEVPRYAPSAPRRPATAPSVNVTPGRMRNGLMVYDGGRS
jgi:hypothetical protein